MHNRVPKLSMQAALHCSWCTCCSQSLQKQACSSGRSVLQTQQMQLLLSVLGMAELELELVESELELETALLLSVPGRAASTAAAAAAGISPTAGKSAEG